MPGNRCLKLVLNESDVFRKVFPVDLQPLPVLVRLVERKVDNNIIMSRLQHGSEI